MTNQLFNSFFFNISLFTDVYKIVFATIFQPSCIYATDYTSPCNVINSKYLGHIKVVDKIHVFSKVSYIETYAELFN